MLGNEPSPERLCTLRQNLAHLNLLNTATCSHPGERLPLPQGLFPRILLDPPCSGWGTAEKHPRVKALWKDDKIDPLARLQRDLLGHAASLLPPGGPMGYTPCTTNPAENEEQVQLALERLGLEPVSLPPLPGFVFHRPADLDCCLLVDGEQSGSQGFFLACLKKSGSHVMPEPLPLDLPGESIPADALAEHGLDPGLLPPGEIFAFGGKAYFLHRLALEHLPRSLRWQGAPIGKAQRGRLRPNPRLWSLLPQYEDCHGQQLEIPELEALLSGREMPASRGGRGLYFRGLRLGLAQVRGSRLLWSEG